QADLDMIADEAAHLGSASRHLPATDRHDDFAVIVPQVAGLCSGPDVHPLAHVAMSEKAVVIFVGKALENARLDLAADAATRAERGAAADFRAHDLSAGADVAWTVEAGERGRVGGGIDPPRAASCGPDAPGRAILRPG